MRRVLLVLAAVAFAVTSARKHVVELKDATFDRQIKDGRWLIKFYAPWCGHWWVCHFGVAREWKEKVSWRRNVVNGWNLFLKQSQKIILKMKFGLARLIAHKKADWKPDSISKGFPRWNTLKTAKSQFPLQVAEKSIQSPNGVLVF